MPGDGRSDDQTLKRSTRSATRSTSRTPSAAPPPSRSPAWPATPMPATPTPPVQRRARSPAACPCLRNSVPVEAQAGQELGRRRRGGRGAAVQEPELRRGDREVRGRGEGDMRLEARRWSRRSSPSSPSRWSGRSSLSST
ncbi:hypothetical protein PVAP13_9NG148700 [Panicum virgatum]|uniref:Uncharacterized protein n=1 Tax=Panicum virgatum TaxID=38727 RepID=A0A8T0MFP4_PANVG|nr:hypothetical protein PVAP13_9NG148700 [Panicum virgatum]